MKITRDTQNTGRQAPPGRRRPERTGRGLRPAAILAALLCSGLLLLAFVVSSRHTARISASYVPPTPESAAETARGSPAPEDPSAAPEDPAMDGSTLFRRLEWKEGQFVLVEYGAGASTELDTSGFTDPSTKNSRDLAQWAEMAWENQWGYVWGTFGQLLTEDLLADKLKQYPEDLAEYEDIIRDNWMGRRVVDCVGLIKSYGWYDPASNSIDYGSNGMPDTGTDGMWDAAEVKGDMDTMPDEPGLLVYSTAGHIGVYVGGGRAIEAISHAGGVVKTQVADRPWTGWLQCPYVRYDNSGG